MPGRAGQVHTTSPRAELPFNSLFGNIRHGQLLDKCVKYNAFVTLCLRQARLAGGDIVFSTCPFVRLSVRLLQTSEDDILKTKESILMPIGISGPRGNDIKRSTLWVRKLKIKVTRGKHINLEAWRRHYSRVLGSSRFSSTFIYFGPIVTCAYTVKIRMLEACRY